MSSTFIVDVRRIEKIWVHPNADKLELGKVEGLDFQLVMQKDLYKVGQLVVYFPVDSLLPQPLMDVFNLTYLSGKDKNRVKTVCLRKAYGQGLMLSLDTFIENGLLPANTQLLQDVTELLGVTKYEPEAVIEKNAFLHQLPEGVPKYDIEGIERFPASVEMLMDVDCWVCEKLEGMNYSITYKVDEDKLYVNSRNNSIVEKEGATHSFWEVTRKMKLDVFIKDIQKQFWSGCNTITIRGEFIGPGVQGNIYKLKQFDVYVFDILVDRTYIDSASLLHLFGTFPHYDIKLVPTLSSCQTLRAWLNGKTISDASDGKSLLEPFTRREGIVIKPLIEMESEELGGRLFLKKRSLEYLANNDL